MTVRVAAAAIQVGEENRIPKMAAEEEVAEEEEEEAVVVVEVELTS